MLFQIETLVTEKGKEEWRAVRPSGGEPPYKYVSEKGAWNAARLCFDVDRTKIRVTAV